MGQLRPTAKGTPKAKVEKEVSQNLVIRNVGVKKNYKFTYSTAKQKANCERLQKAIK